MQTMAAVDGLASTQVQDTSRRILDILSDHALNKLHKSEDQRQGDEDYCLAAIAHYVAQGQRVEACLPAFPFKSANKVYKVLGPLPDKAEELALNRLNTMCDRIAAVYPPGAQVTIISDGITYNDLLCISDQETWNYGETLRKMAKEHHFDHIGFARMRDLLDVPLLKKETLREITYVANCTNFRRLLLNTHGRNNLDIDQEIANNPDTKLTYLGYKRFLESDLKHIFPRGEGGRTANEYRRDCKYLAKQMLIRGYAFAGAVKTAFPNHLRLSIHESISGNKLSISLLNTRTGFTTPWHCSVAQLADGSWISAPMGEFLKDGRLEVVSEHGRPSYFREKASTALTDPITEMTANYLKPTAPKISRDEYLSRASSTTTISSSRTSRDTSPPSSTSASERGLSGKKAKEENEDYGRRLIPQIMDRLAAAEPQKTVFSLTSFAEDGKTLQFREISAKAFTLAVDKTAWWLIEQVGKAGGSSIPAVAYIGPHDLRHILLTYACVKAGYAALFLSPKNTTEGSLAVLDATKCNIWVHAGETAPIPLVQEVLEQRPEMKLLQLPLLDELLDAADTETFPYTKTFAEAVDDPFCYLHTSGTTGVPKPIPWSHGLIGTMDAVRLIPPMQGEDGELLRPWTDNWNAGDRIYSAFPMSHGAGIIMDILMPSLFDLHCVLGPVNVLPNINLVETLAEQAHIDIWSMVPSLVDEVGETPEVLEKLRPSKFICASGGPVSPVSADKVNKVVRVLNLTGTTEGLFIGNLWVPREDWFWFCFHPSSGFEFRELEPDTYEHWVHKIGDEARPLFQGIFHTFPDKPSINFKDLYRRHPSKPNFWAFKGRSDDLVVLSNGYKISPLETEALVTTHPAVKGCLVFGTGKPQAGLLIELNDPASKSDDKTIDSIWETVQKANSLSRHKNQLLRDFVTFAEPDKPFFRTDKGTVKRPATLKLYADFLDRFYSSRDDDAASSAVKIDTSSTESTETGLRSLLSTSLPDLPLSKAASNVNLFDLGLDSLGVFAVVKAIRASTGLGEHIAPRHVYANPSLGQLSGLVQALAAKEHSKTLSEKTALQKALAAHRARQSFRLNALDYVNPNHGMGLVFYFALHETSDVQSVFATLSAGLDRTFDMIPALGGKMMQCSPQEFGYVENDLCVTIPPPHLASSVHNRLKFNDLSDVLPSFSDLQRRGFVPSDVPDHLVMRDDPFPQYPADIFVAQANFVRGGCLLAVELNHCCLDGLGVMVALRAWAENCRFVQGDTTAVCSWYDPESFNHSLPEILHEQEGWANKKMDQIDPGTWGFLPFHPTDAERARLAALTRQDDWTLEPAPVFPVYDVWPLPKAERCTNTTLFVIPPAKVELLQKAVQSELIDAPGGIPSISDIAQAFFWRVAIRARLRAQKKDFSSDATSILELPTDGRPYFSPQLPETYMGSVLLLNRSVLSLDALCNGPVASVAQHLRQAASRFTPSLVHDAFSLLQSLPDHKRFSTANMGLDHLHAMISNMLMFPADAVNFGSALFANNGVAESMRPQLERGNGRFRFLVIFPLRPDGGIELVLGTHPEELAALMTDEEFTKYAELADKAK